MHSIFPENSLSPQCAKLGFFSFFFGYILCCLLTAFVPKILYFGKASYHVHTDLTNAFNNSLRKINSKSCKYSIIFVVRSVFTLQDSLSLPHSKLSQCTMTKIWPNSECHVSRTGNFDCLCIWSHIGIHGICWIVWEHSQVQSGLYQKKYIAPKTVGYSFDWWISRFFFGILFKINIIKNK